MDELLKEGFNVSVVDLQEKLGSLTSSGQHEESVLCLRAVPEIILGGHIFFQTPSTPRTHMGSESPNPQDT